MRYLRLFLLGVIPVLAAGWWIRSKLVAETEAVRHFCGATRAGEPWAQVQARARPLGLEFVRANRSGGTSEEFLAWVESAGYRYGCTVVVVDGRVVSTRGGELPATESAR